ncbi:MAG: hypothetical protein STSR0008_00420 [Ignavibacterium sp.]
MIIKKIIKPILYISLLFLLSCENPVPVDLVNSSQQSEDDLEIEVLSTNPDDETNSSDVDTTGYNNSTFDYQGEIFLSKNIINYQSTTTESNFAQTILFDKSNPIRNWNNRIIGYRSRNLLNIRFNNLSAREVPYIIKMNIDGKIVDSVVGKKYILFHKSNFIYSDSIDFDFGSLVNVELIHSLGRRFSRDLLMPEKILGNIKINTLTNTEYKTVLEWNGLNKDKIQIIIGAYTKTIIPILIPLYRLKTKDDGNLILPKNIIESIPKDKFGRLAFIFIRQNNELINFNGEQIFSRTQSTNTHIINIP